MKKTVMALNLADSSMISMGTPCKRFQFVTEVTIATSSWS